MKKVRGVYAAAFCLLLLTEIGIALFVRDRFIRPYVGDMLVTVLLCCLCRMIWPKGLSALPVYVFVFAVLVETAQYFDIVQLLGLEGFPVIATLVGTTFSWADLVCYAVGCLAFWLAEKGVRAAFGRQNGA